LSPFLKGKIKETGTKKGGGEAHFSLSRCPLLPKKLHILQMDETFLTMQGRNSNKGKEEKNTFSFGRKDGFSTDPTNCKVFQVEEKKKWEGKLETLQRAALPPNPLASHLMEATLT